MKIMTYRDVTFPKDTMLFFPVSVAGRDSSAAANPDEFRPERQHDNRHMAFGRGMHLCLGQFIARAQLEEGLHLIAQRLTAPKLAGKIDHRPFTGVWGLRGLPIEFTPAAARCGVNRRRGRRGPRPDSSKHVLSGRRVHCPTAVCAGAIPMFGAAPAFVMCNSRGGERNGKKYWRVKPPS